VPLPSVYPICPQVGYWFFFPFWQRHHQRVPPPPLPPPRRGIEEVLSLSNVFRSLIHSSTLWPGPHCHACEHIPSHYGWQRSKYAKRRCYVFQGCAPTSRMTGSPKTISDSSGIGLTPVNKVVKLTRVVPSHEQHSRSCGKVDQRGSTSRAANAAAAGDRSAIK
jgi:hypothetical protein